MNAIDRLLDTVSGGSMDCPRFSARYNGDMEQEKFLREVDVYIQDLLGERNALREALEELLEACLSTKMMSSDGVVEDARAALKASEDK